MASLRQGREGAKWGGEQDRLGCVEMEEGGGGVDGGSQQRPKAGRVGGAWTGEVVRGPLTRGPLPQCWVSNRFKPSKSIQTRSNLFQIISNLNHSKKGLPKLEKFEIKYGFEGFKERNNFIHRNSFRFKIYFELKIWEFKI
jgi:hypothetical protein